MYMEYYLLTPLFDILAISSPELIIYPDVIAFRNGPINYLRYSRIPEFNYYWYDYSNRINLTDNKLRKYRKVTHIDAVLGNYNFKLHRTREHLRYYNLIRFNN